MKLKLHSAAAEQGKQHFQSCKSWQRSCSTTASITFHKGKWHYQAWHQKRVFHVENQTGTMEFHPTGHLWGFFGFFWTTRLVMHLFGFLLPALCQINFFALCFQPIPTKPQCGALTLLPISSQVFDSVILEATRVLCCPTCKSLRFLLAVPAPWIHCRSNTPFPHTQSWE